MGRTGGVGGQDWWCRWEGLEVWVGRTGGLGGRTGGVGSRTGGVGSRTGGVGGQDWRCREQDWWVV